MANRKSMEVGATRGVGDTKIFDFVSNATVAIMSDFGTGSGVVISKNGKIVTNYHVVGDSKVVDVYFHDKNKDFEQLEFKKGDVIRVNGKNDLALIQVKSISKNIVPIEIAKSFPRVGKMPMQSDIPTMSFGPIHVDMLVRFGKIRMEL